MKKVKAFTFLELLIVLVLVLSVYALLFTNFDFMSDKKKTVLSLKNLKVQLLEAYKFKKTLKLVCIEEGVECFVFLDGKITKKNKIEDLFKSEPEVYEYSSSLTRMDFKPVRFENQEEYSVSFEYNINQDKKSDEMIVDIEEKVFVFTAINDKATVLQSINDIPDMFEEKVTEVKDAF